MKRSLNFICPTWTIVIFSLSALASAARADNSPGSVRIKLREFSEDTARFMDRVPEKTTTGNQSISTSPLPVGTSKYELINAAMERLAPGRRTSGNLNPEFDSEVPADGGDRAVDLVDKLIFKTLATMREAHLESAQLAQQPWSGSYWPIAKGGTAWRYSDPSFLKSFDWKAVSDYVLNPASTCSVDQLSPAEKYDLLTGDPERTLTRSALHEGERYYRDSGSVEAWMGICHGWAPAAYMVSRPAQSVTVLAADGRTKIHFHPSDIKALTTLLWANGSFENRFIGRRCNDKKPPKDGTGRITDPACYGENPGTWHLSVVNQVGAARRSFILDTVHDTEIWNHPIYGYKYSYFNPQKRNPVTTVEEAEVPIHDFTTDKFKPYRSARASSVVGIAMDLTYVTETDPTTSNADGPAQDTFVKVHYLYDLELDANHEIVGGEWYSNGHPGFLWTPVPGAQAVSAGDAQVSGHWGGDTAIPGLWNQPIQSSARKGQPLAHIVNTLEVLSALIIP